MKRYQLLHSLRKILTSNIYEDFVIEAKTNTECLTQEIDINTTISELYELIEQTILQESRP